MTHPDSFGARSTLDVGGGSIRKPASFTGTFGLKASYGRVPIHPHGAAWSVSHVGPMTRSAADAALVLAAMAGYDPADPSTSVLPVPDYRAALTGTITGLRVGALGADFLEAAAPAVQTAVGEALRRLEQLGAVVDEVRLESIEHVPAAAGRIHLGTAVRTRPAVPRSGTGRDRPPSRPA